MKIHWFFVILALAFVFVSCDDPIDTPANITEDPGNTGGPGNKGGDSVPLSTTYAGTKNGSTYTLVITPRPARIAAGDEYVLTVESPDSLKISRGTIETVVQDNLTLKPNSATQSFSLTVSDTKITFITGTVTFTDGTSTLGPGSFATGNGTPGAVGTTATVTSVTVSPVVASVEKGKTQSFSATVSGTNNPAQTVTWTVTGGGNGTSISTSGLLTVGLNETAASLTVKATSTVDTGKSGTAAVTVKASLSIDSVAVTPSPITLVKGDTQQFTATVTGTHTSKAVTWTVTGGGNGTSINASGVLTIGGDEAPGTLTVKAASNADTSKSGTATVTISEVRPTIDSVAVTPSSGTVAKGGAPMQFSASVTGTNNPSPTVTWSIVEAKHADTSINNGLLTVSAKETLSTLTVKATSTYDSTKSGEATITLTSASVGITLGVADIEDLTPNDSYSITISPNVASGYPQTFQITIANANDYSSITWEIAGVGAYTSQTFTASGSPFALSATNAIYNSPGGHVLILTVVAKKNGKTYQRAIPFTVVH